MNILAKAGKIFDKIIEISMLAAAVIVLVVAFAVAIDVITREGFGLSWSLLFQITEYTIVWMTFLGTAWLMKKEGHVRLELVVSRMKPRSAKIMTIIGYIISAILIGGMVFFTSRLTIHDYQTHLTLSGIARPVKWPIEMIIPIGCLMLFIQVLRNTYRHIMEFKSLPASEQKS